MRVYIADTRNEGPEGRVLVYDLPSGERVGAVETGYSPGVAASTRRRRIFVAQTPTGQGGEVHELTVHDAETLEEEQRHTFQDRHLYNVAPTAPELTAEEDGSRCYLLQCHLVGDDEAEYFLRNLEPDRDGFTGGRLRLPECPIAVGRLPGKPDRFYFDVSGRHGEAVGTERFDHESEKGTRPIVTDRPTTREREDERLGSGFASVGCVPSPDGASVFHVSRAGELRILEASSGELSEPVRLEVPGDQRVPLQQVLASEGRLWVGLADVEMAARGLVDILNEYRVNGGVYRRRAIDVTPPADKIGLSPDGTQLLALSTAERTLTVLDLEDQEVVVRLEDVGETPVQFDVSD